MNCNVRIDASNAGLANMQADLELHALVRDGHVSAGIRFYTWNPWCVSLGKHQNTDNVNLAALEQLGLDLVHRPTGGRAVLHAEEVTYCICVELPDTTRAQQVYASVHDMLYSVLQNIAPTLSHASVSTDLRQHYSSQQPIGQACFSSHAKSEILYGTKKVVGSAQRVFDGVLLQHGSILCGKGHEQLAHVITYSALDADRAIAILEQSSATLTQAAGREVPKEEVLSAVELHKSFINERLQIICSQASEGVAR
jgi:lipoate-protein ligase A